MSEFERAIAFLKTKGIEAYEQDLMINVDVKTADDIGPMAKQLKKLLGECNYSKSWRVRIESNCKPIIQCE